METGEGGWAIHGYVVEGTREIILDLTLLVSFLPFFTGGREILLEPLDDHRATGQRQQRCEHL